MSEYLLTVEQASRELGLHVKTVLRYIREGRLPATKVGKAYRIARASLDELAGVETGKAGQPDRPAATCIVHIPGLTKAEAARTANFLQSAAMSASSAGASLHVETAFDPYTNGMKVIVIGRLEDAIRFLDLVNLRTKARA